MARGKVIEWNGSIGRIRDEADQARVFFGDRGLQGLQPGDVHIGLEVEFDRGHSDRGPAARNVRRPGTESPPPSRPRPVREGGRLPVPTTGRRPIATPPDELALPRSLQALLPRVSPGERHPGLQLDKYSRGGEQTEQREALQQVVAIGGHAALFAELCQRRAAMLQGLRARIWCRTTAGPLTLHLARASALENAGLCLHPVYGFAYLPGTGLKGMARAYAETVWLPGHGAREKLEQVFGRVPAADAEQDGGQAGAVVFHDAWPSAWPRLVVDIVNNHHAGYYQGAEPPGDWEAPVPVYFLAVAPGQEFCFALGKRRADVADELLELAGQWLDGALTLLGCGAKTVAGYGYFQGESDPSRSGRAVCEATLELTAPGFLAGAQQQEADCDLRPATLRGLLRWWWRTLHAGHLPVGQLRALEAALWGDTAAGGAIQIVLSPEARQKPTRFAFKDRFDPQPAFKRQHGLADRPNNRTTQGLFYASYGMDEQSREGPRQRYFLEAGATWRLRLLVRSGRFYADRKKAADARSPGLLIPAELIREQAEAALWLLTMFGAAGSKARKGFGSLQAREEHLTGLNMATCQERAGRLRQHLRLAGGFDPSTAESPCLEQALFLKDLPSPWADPWKVLDEIGFAYQAFAQRYKHDPAKAALGLPRKIHGPRDDGPMPGQSAQDWHRPVFLDFLRGPSVSKGKDARHASPVHFHLARGQDGLLSVRAIAFVSRYLPDAETSRRLLQELLEFLEQRLRERMQQQPGGPPRPSPRPAVAAAGPGKVRVKVLERREQGGKTIFLVQEEGRPRGVLGYGTPPATLPEVGADIEVYRNNNDPRSPQYRWDPPPPPSPPRGQGGRGGPPRRR